MWIESLVPQTPHNGNGLGTHCAGFSRPGSGSARRSGRRVCGHRSRSQRPGHGRVGPARQRGGRMAPLRWGVRESPGAASGDDGSRHGREAVRTPRRREGLSLATEETAGSPFTIHAPRAAGDRRGNPPWLPDSTHAPEHKLFRNQRPLLRPLLQPRSQRDGVPSSALLLPSSLSHQISPCHRGQCPPGRDRPYSVFSRLDPLWPWRH